MTMFPVQPWEFSTPILGFGLRTVWGHRYWWHYYFALIEFFSWIKCVLFNVISQISYLPYSDSYGQYYHSLHVPKDFASLKYTNKYINFDILDRIVPWLTHTFFLTYTHICVCGRNMQFVFYFGKFHLRIITSSFLAVNCNRKIVLIGLAWNAFKLFISPIFSENIDISLLADELWWVKVTGPRCGRCVAVSCRPNTARDIPRVMTYCSSALCNSQINKNKGNH